MTLRSVRTAMIIAIAAGSLAACGGGRTNQTTTVQTTTTGQELQDLQMAFDEGLITQKEYDKKRKEILKR